MNSLKRTLSLVLVLVMVLGLFGVAGAAYKDEAKIQYKEAVNVMTGIGAIEGDNGAFDPAGNLTRAAAAKMVAYTVLGADVAKTLPVKVSSFKDVNANFAWAIPSIEYLVSKGIIEGYNKDTFGPNDKVTGNQLAKMLLVALGVKGDFSSASWELNTAIAARKINLFNGTKATDFSAAATREEAALYCFNAICYSAAGETVKYVVKNGDVVVSTWDSFFEAYLAAQGHAGYTIATIKTSVGSIADTLYKLENAIATDDFGRPGARTWKYKNKEISKELTSSPIITYTTAVTGKALKLALANIGYTLPAQLDVVRNGGTVNQYATGDGFDAASFGGNGTAIEVYGDGKGNVTKAVVVVTYVGTVKTINTDNATTTTVDESSIVVEVAGLKASGLSDIAISSTTPGFAAAYAFANAAKASGISAPLLVTPNGDNSASTKALTVLVPKYETLTASSYVAPVGIAGGSFTVGTTTYKYSDTAILKLGVGGAYNFKPFTAVYDAYGYVIATTDVASTPAANYAYVVRTAATFDVWGTPSYQAELLLSDGTTKVVPTDVNYKSYNKVEHHLNGKDFAGEIVTFKEVSGKTVLTPADATTKVAAGAIDIKTGKAVYTFNGSKVADANTVFVVGTTNPTTNVTTYVAYKGIANVPSFKNESGKTGAVYATAGMSNFVYLNNPTSAGTTTTDKFFVSHVGTLPIITATGSYYQATAVVNGEIKTVKLAADYDIGVYTVITYDANGIATLAVPSGSAISAIAPAANGVIKISDVYYGYTTDCVVYFFNATGITAAKVSDISATSTGWFTFNANGVVNAIYLAK